MKSVMTHQFSRSPQAQLPRSSFNRSHGVKTAFDADYLVPFLVDEILPGDTFNVRTSAFVRMSTPIYPIMDNIFLDTFYFFIPLRLVWDNFRKMMGERLNPTDSVDFTMPVMALGTPGVGSLSDYLGIRTGVAGIVATSVFHRAYNLVWNEWFRDQNLQLAAPVDKDDGPDSIADYFLLKRGKRHDYFTSCLPWPQKGDSVPLPLGTTAPVQSDGFTVLWETLSPADVYSFHAVGSNDNVQFSHTPVSGDAALRYADQGLEVDLSAATAATINQLRQAFQIQKLYERDARGGTRYIEMVRSHFGVISPDARLQRPEYLGGGSTPINITPIVQTSESGTTPQGNLAAMGTASFSGHGFTKSFTEHGILLGLVNVRADLTYQQGLNRMFSRSDRLSFYWPELAQIGEQAVLNQEIFVQGNSADFEVFGYQEAFAEYRYKPSTIHSVFRSDAATSLDPWHLSQDFSSLPTLGNTFIQSNTPMSRVLAVPSEPHFIADFYHRMDCARIMPLYGVPGNIDHF